MSWIDFIKYCRVHLSYVVLEFENVFCCAFWVCLYQLVQLLQSRVRVLNLSVLRIWGNIRYDVHGEFCALLH
jgi:hypothetical protein